MDDDPYHKRLHFAEQFGLFFEQNGLPRMAGRIFAWLLVADDPLQSMSDLAEALQASKSSISTTTRLLIRLGLLERVSLPGHRRDYYRVRPGYGPQLMVGKVLVVRAARELMEEGLALAADTNVETRAMLEELRDLYAFLERELPRLLERWQAERTDQSG